MTPNGKILKDAMAALKKPAKTRMPSNVSLPMFQNGGGLLSRSVTCSNCGHSWKSVEGGADPLDCHKCGGMVEMGKGGYVVSRSDDRKGKTHKVTGPDGTVKYFGDSKLGQHPKDPERKAAFYARHKKNLDGNPFFRAFARKTWADGGEISPYDMFDDGGESKGPGPKKPQPIYVDNPNDPRIGQYTEKGNQYLYKKPAAKESQLPTIYTENLKDPRLKAYTDSLNAYNAGEFMYKFGKDIYNQVRSPKNNEFRNNYNIRRVDTKGIPFIDTNIYPVESYNETYDRKPGSFWEQNVNDNRPNYYIGNNGEHWEPIGTTWSRFKKPVQPVVYKTPESTYVKKFGLTNDDIKRAFATKPISKKDGDPYYNISKGGKNYKIHAQSGGLDYIEEIKPPKKTIKQEPTAPVSQQSVIQQPVRLPIPLMQDMAEPVFEDLSASPYRVDYSGGSKYFPSIVEGEAFMKQINTDFMNNRGANPGNVSGYYNTKKLQKGGQHGGLDRWFAEKWVDVKTGKACGRQEGEKRAGYPACRPSRRVNDDTPKTSSELSSSEREKFKRSKTSSDRINYQHRRKEDGGEINETDMANKPNNPSLWSRAKSLARQKFDVYPSAYANGWAAKWYKGKGGTWRKAEYGMQLMGEGGINNPGFRALPPAVQQNIMDNMASGGERMPPEIARARFAAAGNTDMLDDYGYAYGGYMPEMGFGGYHNPYMAGGGSTYSGNAFYGDGGMYPMYAEAGPVDPNGRFHGEWQDDPMLAEQFGYSQDMSEDEMLASQDAANVAAYPMKPTSIKVNTPKALPGKKGQGSGSIVDFLNSQGAKSDYATRKAIAEGVYGFGKYTGSAEQNKRLLDIMIGDMGSTTEGSNQRSYNQNDGNMLRQGFDSSFDSRYPQFGSPRPGVPAQVYTPAAKQAAQSQKPGKRKPLFGKTADEFIAEDPYFFAEESDGSFAKALDYPFTMLRNAGARVVLDQDPMALFSLLAAGAGTRGLIGKTRTMPYDVPKGPKGLPGGANRALPGPGPRQIAAPRPSSSPRPGAPSGGYMEFGRDFAPRLGPQGFQTGSGMRSPGFPMYAKGGYVEGQEMDVTPEQMERLRQQGYQFEII